MEGIESPGDILLSRGGHYFWLGITAQHTREGFFSVSAYCGVGSRQLTGQALQRTSYRELLGVDFRSDCSIDNFPILAQHLAFWNIRALLGAPDCPIDLVWDFSACVEYYIDWTGVGSRLLATLAQALLLFGAGVGSLNFILLALQIIFRLLGVGSQHHSLAQRLQTTGVGSLFYQLLAWFLVLVAGVGLPFFSLALLHNISILPGSSTLVQFRVQLPYFFHSNSDNFIFTRLYPAPAGLGP